VIDGTVGAAEWRGSLVVNLAGAGQLFFRHDDRFLYVGIRADEPGFASLCIARADTIRVLQAASALGSARYQRTAHDWALISGFDWQLRSPSRSTRARAERQEYLATYGWLATTRQQGARQKEFQIALDQLPRDGIPIALVYRTEAGPSWRWPATMHDGCSSLMLVAGVDVEHLAFAPEQWTRLTLGGARRDGLRTASRR
jgi:hypothetical protein